MRAEPAMADTSKLELPHDLIAELQRRGPSRKVDFHVESWKPSFFGRFMEILAGGKRKR